MSLSYHESNLSLIAQETMRLLVNHQLISLAKQPKSVSLEQICYTISQDVTVTSLKFLHLDDNKINTFNFIKTFSNYIYPTELY